MNRGEHFHEVSSIGIDSLDERLSAALIVAILLASSLSDVGIDSCDALSFVQALRRASILTQSPSSLDVME